MIAAFDVRSIILFRICFGIYILYDILYTRLGFRWSLKEVLSFPIVDYHIPWYTQSSAYVNSSTIAYLHVSDTPHQSYPHKIWFYRGSAIFQYVLYTLTCLMAIGFSFGVFDIYSLQRDRSSLSIQQPIKKTVGEADKKGIHEVQEDVVARFKTTSSLYTLNPYSVLCKCIFWLLVTSFQNRNMFVHDGSDTYTRLLLLYSCFIPLRFSKHDYPTYTITTSPQSAILIKHSYSVSSISTTSLSLQIVFMYLGTVCCRTVDRMDYHTMFSFWHPTNEWLLPSLSAVYNSLCIGNFATRDNLLTRFICSHYLLCQAMTFSAIIIELCCPIIGFILLLWRSRILGKCNSNKVVSVTTINLLVLYVSIIPLLLLHLGLLCCLRLPNWQSVAMIALLPWVPAAVYDPKPPRIATRTAELFSQQWASYKKTDGDLTLARSTSLETPIRNCHHHFAVQSHSRFLRWTQYFLLLYMIYNFGAERHIIPKYDQGDIGEFFRVSQYWVMYSTVGTITHTTRIAGSISSFHIHPENASGNLTGSGNEKSLDLLRFIATGGKDIQLPEPILVNTSLSLASLRSSVPYPTVRWERALYTWSKDSYESQFHSKKKILVERRMQHFGLSLCQLVNKELNTLQNEHIPTDSRFLQARQSHERFLTWILKEAFDEEGLQKENSSLKIFLKEIEIRFQHLQILQRKNVQIAAPDFVTLVSCNSLLEEES